jgi:hypothetical protein
MAEDQVGLRTEAPRSLPLWTRLFTGFKVARDPKKLLLAAAGIVTMWVGWWVLSVIFYNARSKPIWDNFKGTFEKNEDSWKAFKEARNAWNLLYEMAGPGPRTLKEAKEYGSFDAGDFANSPEEYDQIQAAADAMRKEISLRTATVTVEYDANKGISGFQVGEHYIGFDPPKGGASREDLVKALQAKEKALTPPKLVDAYRQKDNTLVLDGLTLTNIPTEQWERFRKDLVNSKQPSDIEREILEGRRGPHPEIAKKALELVLTENQRFKPAGYLRTAPWSEYRGPNPYLLITGRAGQPAADGQPRTVPWVQGHFFDWFLHDQMPVLLEPLFKFFRPVLYLLYPAAGGWNRLYLILVILWSLATWAVFGGAITRMAAVEVARNNERIRVIDAWRFAWSRVTSFFMAPLLPLAFMGILALLLLLFGLVVGWTWILGDIVVAGLLLPLALLLALIIAVVLVGLVGWPVMYSTISTEGSDSFDAISRSYSYVYQAPWHYLWFGLVALAYGAILVFFVGLMGSLIAYTTRWGMQLAPTAQDREPSYLFTYAPESFGWRDLLLYQSPNAEATAVVRPNGLVAKQMNVRFTPSDGAYPFTWNNWVGAALVALWLSILFLLVVGFGYSYFWTASTSIYLLMRRKVDETDLDEIHLEEEAEEPYTPPAPAATAPAGKPGATSLAMVEPPVLRTPPAAPATPPAATAGVVPPEAPEPPPNPSAAPPVVAAEATGATPPHPSEPAPEATPAPDPTPPGPGTDPRPEGGPDRGSL